MQPYCDIIHPMEAIQTSRIQIKLQSKVILLYIRKKRKLHDFNSQRCVNV